MKAPLSLIVTAALLRGAAAVGLETQPLLAQVARLTEAMEFLGNPLAAETKTALARAAEWESDAAVARAVQEALDPLCLFEIHINPESRVKVAQGAAKAELDEGGWRCFLVKILNEAGVTAELRVESPNAAPVFAQAYPNPPTLLSRAEIANRWLEAQMFNKQPLRAKLGGLPLEYRIVQLYSRDAGKREARISFHVGQGTQDIGFRNEADVLFDCRPATEVVFRVRDTDGKPTMASFLIRDKQSRVYPSQAKRLAPDFAFQPQIYREDGERLKLPAGEYSVEVGRGPEYMRQTQTLIVGRRRATLTANLQRWIDPSKLGWWSGDHHIHAAGCAHYTNPTEGVHAPDMYRHCVGEDLKVGCNLTWGPCFDYQKNFFTGKVDKISQYPYLLRYDIEVSGFGSHQSGHLVLLRLKEGNYPGGDSNTHWPTLGLNTLRWAKKQGAVVGPAHSGWGLQVKGNELPNYNIPPYDGIGANEYVVDVTHTVEGPHGEPVPAVDFMSLCDTPPVWELNMWYHTLNCGFRTRVSGETDFPCIYGERVGLGRSYVKLDGTLDFDQWCEEIRNGRAYVSDGYSHLMEFRVNDVRVGENGSELKLAAPAAVRVRAQVAALLSETRANRDFQRYYWHIEKARVPNTREVPVELIINGQSVARLNIIADGKLREVAFDATMDRSSWVALRIFPSSHTNPIFVLVDDKPIRASRRSAQWCLRGVDQCWSQKQRFLAPAEMEDAKAAYEHARQTYRKILAECVVE